MSAPADAFAADTPLPCTIRPSPNHGDRRGRTIDSVILHYTQMPSAEGALRWLCDPASQVSSHYVIDEAGGLFQLVPEGRRAWHAGRSYWQGERDLNSVSIGIEIANLGHDGGLPPYPDPQIEAVIALCRDLAARNGIAPHRFLGHSDIAPDRKTDPGEHFPWERLAEAGFGLWPSDNIRVQKSTILVGTAIGSRIATLQKSLCAWGLELPETAAFDRATLLGITAFQRHFRPGRVDGVVDAETIAILDAVIAMHKKQAPEGA